MKVEDDRPHVGPERLTPVALRNVRVEGGFWGSRIDVNRTQTIPHLYDEFLASGALEAFRLQWQAGEDPEPLNFRDSDVYKWIEAASYSLTTNPDGNLDRILDDLVDLIASAQQPDGYLNVYYTTVRKNERWTNLLEGHELYCAGHLMEAAVAHFQATGKRTLLNVAFRCADHIERIFGTAQGKKRGYPGHEEVELALVRLYRLVGERRYLQLSRYFIDERGRQPHYFDRELRERGKDPAKWWPIPMDWSKGFELFQAHVPVREQTEAVGHAVRAVYLFSAVADLAYELGDAELETVAWGLWRNVCRKRMYVTGGIGSSRLGEKFTFDYDLPNEAAYCETCAAVGLVFWCHRMLQLHCDGEYADVMERVLYNGALSGLSIDGKKFFYENRLASMGNHHRQKMFDCACCPPNIARLIASLGQYVYSQNGSEAVVHLYIQSSGRLAIAGQTLTLRQETDYPWDTRVSIRLELQRPAKFALKLRIPGWARRFDVSVNGVTTEGVDQVHRGYLRLARVWEDGDRVELVFPMPIERVRSHPNVRQNIGRVALQRGPIVYCVEEADNNVALDRLSLSTRATLSSHFDKDLLGGVVVIHAEAELLDDSGWGERPYSARPQKTAACRMTAVPYWAWDNREAGEMQVWIRESRD